MMPLHLWLLLKAVLLSMNMLNVLAFLALIGTQPAWDVGLGSAYQYWREHPEPERAVHATAEQYQGWWPSCSCAGASPFSGPGSWECDWLCPCLFAASSGSGLAHCLLWDGGSFPRRRLCLWLSFYLPWKSLGLGSAKDRSHQARCVLLRCRSRQSCCFLGLRRLQGTFPYSLHHSLPHFKAVILKIWKQARFRLF